ncbi:LytR/AlgR family response regulator transcription factor [candidate division KSB1 bacterium]
MARRKIRYLLKKEENIEQIDEARDGIEAVKVIEENFPDIIFLDVQMPGMDGFGVIEKIGINKMPHIIFVTAFDKYALKAFDVNAVDYLLKPFNKTRFKKSLNKAVKSINSKKLDEFKSNLDMLIQDIRNKDKYSDRLILKSVNRYIFLKSEEIEWIESAGNYLTIHSGKENHILRDTMNNFENKLDNKKFLRIHRQTIVNIDSIKGIEYRYNEKYKVLLKNGIKLPLGYKYYDKFKKYFKDELRDT